MPRFFPVIEVGEAAGDFWLPYPSTTTSRFVELGGDVLDDELALIVITLCTYGRAQDGAASLSELASEFPVAAPGGIAVSDAGFEIFPSCCCGLEGWRDWYGLLGNASTPWLGHDPAPWVERNGESFVMWTDGGLPSVARESIGHISFDPRELADGLNRVREALLAFADRLHDRLRRLSEADARAVSECFRQVFVAGAEGDPSVPGTGEE
ncbi:MAG: hypothetical protein JWM10_4834 [Myxococcaceae bacterium]|nr:hypothetical protein [Myxococcaceae bacterium]